MKRLFASRSGFTLIELIVTIGISLLAVGGLIVNYNNYNDNQRLKQAALTMKNNLRYAQTLAASSKKPTSGCTELVGYTVQFTDSTYTVVAECTEGAVGDALSTALPSGITFSPVPASFVYGVLTRGLLSSDAVTITMVGIVKSYRIQVSTGGDINDLGFL
ncbi:prepilin-type N-terminal cleavage/methylation domain-containing protein [Candidatus Gottesmanbacteria bacterium]|nr:prepilin-type N-terminal cleavage/methylation domain-containing protein [Candidatus Gottesmanbacteria bacterium]